ncbi:hypothetical protein NMG60_11034432 [Bertholletia excelsa]
MTPTKPRSTSSREVFRRYRTIKMAADESMASAVGTRRAWSRAMLWKLRSEAKRRRRSKSRIRCFSGRKGIAVAGQAKTADLRRLVPGGQAMDLCSLLDETAHYIGCLTTQVHVMRNIVHFCSS